MVQKLQKKRIKNCEVGVQKGFILHHSLKELAYKSVLKEKNNLPILLRRSSSYHHIGLNGCCTMKEYVLSQNFLSPNGYLSIAYQKINAKFVTNTSMLISGERWASGSSLPREQTIVLVRTLAEMLERELPSTSHSFVPVRASSP